LTVKSPARDPGTGIAEVTNVLRTSRTAKYTILQDGIGVLPDDIQLLTHHMCWLFGRVTEVY